MFILSKKYCSWNINSKRTYQRLLVSKITDYRRYYSSCLFPLNPLPQSEIYSLTCIYLVWFRLLLIEIKLLSEFPENNNKSKLLFPNNCRIGQIINNRSFFFKREACSRQDRRKLKNNDYFAYDHSVPRCYFSGRISNFVDEAIAGDCNRGDKVAHKIIFLPIKCSHQWIKGTPLVQRKIAFKCQNLQGVKPRIVSQLFCQQSGLFLYIGNHWTFQENCRCIKIRIKFDTKIDYIQLQSLQFLLRIIKRFHLNSSHQFDKYKIITSMKARSSVKTRPSSNSNKKRSNTGKKHDSMMSLESDLSNITPSKKQMHYIIKEALLKNGRICYVGELDGKRKTFNRTEVITSHSRFEDALNFYHLELMRLLNIDPNDPHKTENL